LLLSLLLVPHQPKKQNKPNQTKSNQTKSNIIFIKFSELSINVGCVFRLASIFVENQIKSFGFAQDLHE
jgi:hypothetical protein